jgi:hypothetical protein
MPRTTAQSRRMLFALSAPPPAFDRRADRRGDPYTQTRFTRCRKRCSRPAPPRPSWGSKKDVQVIDYYFVAWRFYVEYNAGMNIAYSIPPKFHPSLFRETKRSHGHYTMLLTVNAVSPKFAFKLPPPSFHKLTEVKKDIFASKEINSSPHFCKPDDTNRLGHNYKRKPIRPESPPEVNIWRQFTEELDYT